MAISTYCSLNRFPPPPPISRNPEASCSCPISKERALKSKCLLSITCAIIGLQIGEFPAIGDASAMDMQLGSRTVNGGPRWSDRTACRPWRSNSLETIVPENLPRPSARRRWEATGFSRVAPPVKVVVISGANSCFNL
ncbi:hypothetical protein ACS0TY_012185 [Phlomoides rotata]